MTIPCNSRTNEFAEILKHLSQEDIELIAKVFAKYLPSNPQDIGGDTIINLLNALSVILNENTHKFMLYLVTVHPNCLKNSIDNVKLNMIKEIIIENLLPLKRIAEKLFDLDKRVSNIEIDPLKEEAEAKAWARIITWSGRVIEIILDKDDLATFCRAYERLFVARQLSIGK